MSAFSISINVAQTSLGVPSPEALESGAEPHVEVILSVAQMLPFAQAGQAPVMAHIGDVRYNLDRDTAIKFFQQGLEQAEKLPAPSKLTVATDLSAVEAVGQEMNRMRGND